MQASTGYGPAGPQTAPLSGVGCAWFRVTVIRSPSRRATGESGPDFDVILQIDAPGWPVIADHDGRIPVDPRLVAPSTLFDPIQTESRITDSTTAEHHWSAPNPPSCLSAPILADMRKADQLRLIEVRVPHGVPVYATGRVTSRGLRPSRLGPTVLTPGTRASVLAARRESVRTGRTTAIVMFLIGFLLAAPAAVWLSSLI
ncbi:hypothetical protein [Actinoplanes couchii]|uniref:RING-type E3 ubiquitin transferase n=1 Tax=Actinoplanes couchii TaxID=403638 RepID=A0ABQ3XU62_9ACTN|nr:hypothetical protein [Actinoplanes couchii]MDR6317755.1 hypothetical protein [Actinoplanes couchii]GID61998.1 hypothetical protein Aco03nite_104020 [Actinoplanes couchii]